MSRFGFMSGICLLFAPVPVHCFSITFIKTAETTFNVLVVTQTILMEEARVVEFVIEFRVLNKRIIPSTHYIIFCSFNDPFPPSKRNQRHIKIISNIVMKH